MITIENASKFEENMLIKIRYKQDINQGVYRKAKGGKKNYIS